LPVLKMTGAGDDIRNIQSSHGQRWLGFNDRAALSAFQNPSRSFAIGMELGGVNVFAVGIVNEGRREAAGLKAPKRLQIR
jgi:hypothetical protein